MNWLLCYGEKCLSCSDRKHCTTYYEHKAVDAIEKIPYEKLIDAETLLNNIIPWIYHHPSGRGKGMNDEKLNCKNCNYKYCPFCGSNRKIFAFFAKIMSR